MVIPVEIVRKVEEYEAAMKESEQLFNEVSKWLKDNAATDDVYIDEIFITDTPYGDKQKDGEYCIETSMGESGDSYSGSYYYPIEGSKKYLAYGYWC